MDKVYNQFVLVTTKPFELNQQKVDKIDKQIIKSIKSNKNFKFTFNNCLDYMICLDEYDFKYNKDFYLDKMNNINENQKCFIYKLYITEASVMNLVSVGFFQ